MQGLKTKGKAIFPLIKNTFQKESCRFNQIRGSNEKIMENYRRNFSSLNGLQHQKLQKLKFDETQVVQMQDMITLVDENDNVIGPISKLDAHFKTEHSLISNPQRLPHRAFSLLLFNSRDELLLAAVRRAEFELGIKELDAERDLSVGARILYYADNCDQFAEHELDYIIFAKKDLTDWSPQKHVNKDEVRDVEWVSRSNFQEFLDFKRDQDDSDITPWFKLLKESRLMKWWEILEQRNEFPKESDHIERFI
eukprot:403357917